MSVRVGFSGTRQGMTGMQAREVLQTLATLRPGEIHHGDCQGADEECHRMVRHLWPVVLHPPDDPKLRAFCEGAREVRDPLPFLKRNREIVDATDILVAAPGTSKMPKGNRGGGTWATVRYAVKQGRPVMIHWIDGEITRM